MYKARVAGTYHEMGKDHGSALFGVGFRLPPQSEEAVAFGKECEPEIARVFPGIRDEIQGFAEGCHSHYEDLLAFMAAIGIRPPKAGCSVFATSAGPSTVFGRNYDFLYAFADYSEHYITEPDGGVPSVANTDVFIGREDGVNAKGVAVGISSVSSRARGPGMNFPLLARCVLDTCSSADQAIEALAGAKHSTSTNYLVADGTGMMAVVEASPGRVAVRKPAPGASSIVSTNHFLLGDMSSAEDVPSRDSDSAQRFEAISEALAGAGHALTLEGAERILSDHSGRVCSHHDGIKMGTLWSTVADLESGEILLAEGHPCTAAYSREDYLGGKLPGRGLRRHNA